jgi:hypothetical protein
MLRIGFDDVHTALDWSRESRHDCHTEGSFDEKPSDLCHNAPASPTQTGSLLCQLTQKKVTSPQIGALLCRIRYSTRGG